MMLLRTIPIFLLAVMMGGANGSAAGEGDLDPTRRTREALQKQGLTAHAIPTAHVHEGIEPADFV